MSESLSEAEPSSDAAGESRSKAMGRSTRLVLLSTVVAKPIQLATSVFIARLLGPAGFGVLGLANSAAVTLSGVSGMGFGDAAAKFIAQHFRLRRSTAEAYASTIWWATSTLGVALMVSGWVLRRFWIEHLFPSGTSGAVIALCLVLAVANLLSSLCLNIFNGLQSFREISLLGVAQPVLFLLLAVVLGRLFAVPGILAASIGTAILLVGWSVRRILSIDAALMAPKSVRPRVLLDVTSFGFPIWIAAFVVNPITVFTFAFLGKQANGAFELGVINVAYALKMIVAILPGVITPVVSPAIIEAVTNDPVEKYSTLVRDVMVAYAILTIPVTVGCVFYSDVLFAVYGHQYAASYRLFMPLATSIAVGVFEAPLQFMILARGKTWWLLILAVLKSCLILVLALVFVPSHRASGLAWSMFSGEVVVAVLLGELCVASRIVSRGIVALYYSYVAVVLALMTLAVSSGEIVRWSTGVPIAFLASVLMIRLRPAVVGWIVAAAPAALRPAMHRTLRFVLPPA